MTRKWKISLLMLAASFAGFAQEHRWAGRTLDQLEWTIHERIAALPSHGVYDSVRFELTGDTVILTGQVIRDGARETVERAARNVEGVRNVVNQIEVLPSSRKDDALRMRLYRAIYDNPDLAKYAQRDAPSIHLVVKNGWLTLEGVVDSEADRRTVHLNALKVTHHVFDHLRVAPLLPSGESR